MIEAEWWEYDSADEMADAVAGDIGFIVESAIDARNEALLALPGGTTPLPIFARLAEAKLPWKRLGTPDEIARGIVFLSDPESDYITGSTLSIDGGITLPWWAARGSAAPE